MKLPKALGRRQGGCVQIQSLGMQHKMKELWGRAPFSVCSGEDEAVSEIGKLGKCGMLPEDPFRKQSEGLSILGVRKIKSSPLVSSIIFFFAFLFFSHLCEQNFTPERSGRWSGGWWAVCRLPAVRSEIRLRHVFLTDGVVREDFSPFPPL